MQESSISEKIKELRTDLKMNQKNFSAAIGIRQSTLSSYENGVVTPSNDVLLTIAQKFHVSLDWLFGLSENKVQISTLSDIIWVLLQMNAYSARTAHPFRRNGAPFRFKLSKAQQVD